MSATGTHIISTLSWNTAFDSKERSAELQERLSSWCKRKAQLIFREVLDKICPPDQTWKIDALELDLGGIDYNNLEAELSLRVHRQLTEKLSDLLIDTQHSSSGRIEIHHPEMAQLLLLERFLLEGVMPWNQLSAGITAEQMIDEQLRRNRRAATEMLWRAGATHENVRKRMAWQFSHPVVLRIIEALEPDHHEEISSFSTELTRAQQEENLVHGSTEAFRRDVTLWVLNYLFDERGTLFNRVAFMESTLRQMAAHHNVRYEALFEQIRQALVKINARRKVAADFMLTLKSLSEQKQVAAQDKSDRKTFQADHWYALEVLFRDHELRSTQKARFNELISALAKENADRLSKLITTFGTEQDFWERVIADLHGPALEVIFYAVSPAQAEQLAESTFFMQELSRIARMGISENEIRQFALLHLLTNRSGSLNYVTLVNDFLSETQDDVQELIRLLACAESVAIKSVAAIEISRVISKKMMDRAVHTTAHSEQFTSLLSLYTTQLHNRTMDAQFVQQLQQVLAAIIRTHPVRAFEQLASAAGRYDYRMLLPHLLDDATMKELIRSARPELYRVIKSVETAFRGQQIILPATEFILRRPDGSASQLWEFFLGKARETDVRHMILHAAAKNGTVLSAGIAPHMKEPFFADEVIALLRESSSAQAQLQEVLQGVQHPEFLAWIKNTDKKTEAVLEYLVPGGARLMKKSLRAFTADLKHRLPALSETELKARLHEIFWQCAIDYSDHKGNRSILLNAFRAAVLAAFPLQAKYPLRGSVRASSENRSAAEHVLSSGEVVKTRQLFLLLEKCLTGVRTEADRDGKKYQLGELLHHALRLQPAEVRRMIAGLAGANQRIEVLKKAISFEEFSAWIVSDLRIDVTKCVEVMQWFYDVAAAVSSATLPEKLVNDYWKELWQVIRTGTFTQDDMKRLIRLSLTALAHDMDVDLETIAALMRENKIALHPFLRAELIRAFPVLSALPQQDIKAKHSDILIVYQNKGLLGKLTEYLVTRHHVPSWLGTAGTAGATELLSEILQHHPSEFFNVIRRETIPEQQMQWLSRSLDIKTLAQSIGQLHRDKQNLLVMIGELGHALNHVRIDGLPAVTLHEIIFRKLISAWKSGNWKIISSENIWNELLWEVCVKHSVPKQTFIQALYKSRTMFPPALQLTLEQLRSRVRASQPSVPAPAAKKKTPAIATTPKTPVQGIAVRNAGIVLLSTYVQTLFTRLGLVNNGKFISTSLQAEAVHYLQYVITGLQRTNESLLPLNKVFCGLPLSHPVADGVEISEEHRRLMDGLIKAAIGHWPALEGCTIEAFRGNWLVREGILSELPDKWELHVEKRPYDVLIQRSPFAFSIIRYPWMDKPLHVTWRY